MRFITILLFLSIIGYNLIGQSFPVPNIDRKKSATKMNGVTTIHYGGESSKHVLGSAYLSEAWLHGYIKLKTGETVEDIKLRYNIWQDMMELVVNGKDTLNIDSPVKVAEVGFGGKVFQYNIIKEPGNIIKGGYFELLTNGHVKLLVRREMKISSDSYVSNYMGGGGSGASYYVTIDNLYIKRGQGGAVRLKKTKKALIEALSDREDEVEKFISEKKLNVTKVKDIIEIVNYYNRITNV